MKTLSTLLATFALAASAHAVLIPYDLIGIAGAGLLFGNEPVASGGTGGEIGAGLQFDNVALTLAINVGWGSSQGFTDLTSAASASHIHGSTASNNGAGFTQTAGVLFTLTRSSNLATGGTITQTIALNSAQATDLQNGKFYLNIHTATNGGGELRGFLVPAVVPEPSSALLALMGGGSLLAFRRRR